MWVKSLGSMGSGLRFMRLWIGSGFRGFVVEDAAFMGLGLQFNSPKGQGIKVQTLMIQFLWFRIDV